MIAQIPVPRDIPLALPLPHWLLVALLIFSFLLHILFINLMVGGSLLALWYQIKGLKNAAYDSLAREIANTITVNKSLAVVLGVAPLLTINVLYTVYFYSANALTGLMWIAIIPWVAVAFLFLYAHKYLWEKLSNNKGLHIALLGIAVFSFLFIPFIFLANINLMLFPEKWEMIKGFLSTLTIPNVFPRYFHFITASIAITGLFMVFYFKRSSYQLPDQMEGISKKELIRKGYSITLVATLLQFIFGPVLFLTLPTKGINWTLFFVISGGILFAILSAYYIWKEITLPGQNPGRWSVLIASFLGITVLFMGTGRHIYRANALGPHQEQVAIKTTNHYRLVEKAKNMKVQDNLNTEISGEELFNANCLACHAPEKRLVGPPIKEIWPIYTNQKQELINWIVDPGRKRADYPPMTPFPNLTQEQLNKIADYFLALENEFDFL